MGRIGKQENIHKAYSTKHIPLKIHNSDAKINTPLRQQTHSGLIQAAYGTVGQVTANEPDVTQQT